MNLLAPGFRSLSLNFAPAKGKGKGDGRREIIAHLGPRPGDEEEIVKKIENGKDE